ncbi:maleylpyruvate isomerase family mycothiol-dependent enzyme [Streptomyces sp. ISL-11]|uniref:maleylpyruvate isomerase family mycothiol-dependent enzyme n=1 Tax=Streptomyces sp. ISL-11 TaxID=2819174 RepID=UPI001BE5F774|nr:maleylpyruvate isomerase family mycothiol-dependent enzyme [Streptomyces sp. ISL-11]MBT2382797.1 maleylpyruvate isomerase family mycothiol-dependent enzyme [Streptomyces sp. ISL-11]
MDYLPHFQREVSAFEAVARQVAGDGAAAPMVPSCPEWSVTDLVGHLGWVQRFVAHIVRERLAAPPDRADTTYLGLPADLRGWPSPERSPHHGPVPAGLVDWFAEGARALEAVFREHDPAEPVWTWSEERTTGFWLRMQTIEAAVHRWDAENARGVPQPVDAELAAAAIGHDFAVMAPTRRARGEARPGSGESFRFRRTDGAGRWTVRFEGGGMRAGDRGDEAAAGPCDVEIAGTASDLMLFLWHRLPAGRLGEVKGDPEVLDRWFVLVPPL